MAQRRTSRGRDITLVLVAVLLAALGLYRSTANNAPPLPSALLDARPPDTAGSAKESVRVPSYRLPRGELPAAPAAPRPAVPAPQARPAPPVFDLASIARAGADESKQEQRFRTNDRFTEDDLQHPEIYFSVAERMAELNRPEERRDTLDFFLAYRDKLGHDLETAGPSPDKRQPILAAIERYDSAITRLRKLVTNDGAQ